MRGRRFLHPKLSFTFTAPEGFTLDNTAQAVFGVKEGGGQALRLDVVRVPAEQTLKDYLLSGWIENIDPKSVEEINVNGFPAATATATGDQWAFRLYAVRFGSDVYRFIFAAKNRTEAVERGFRDSINSFRRMTLAESRAAKPLRLKVVRVGPGDTIDRLAAPHGGRRPADRAFPRAERARPEATSCTRAKWSRSWWNSTVPISQASCPRIAVRRTASLRSPMSRASTSCLRTMSKAWMAGTSPAMTAWKFVTSRW